MHATAFIQSQETHELTLVSVCLPTNELFVDNSQQRKSEVDEINTCIINLYLVYNQTKTFVLFN